MDDIETSKLNNDTPAAHPLAPERRTRPTAQQLMDKIDGAQARCFIEEAIGATTIDETISLGPLDRTIRIAQYLSVPPNKEKLHKAVAQLAGRSGHSGPSHEGAESSPASPPGGSQPGLDQPVISGWTRGGDGRLTRGGSNIDVRRKERKEEQSAKRAGQPGKGNDDQGRGL